MHTWGPSPTHAIESSAHADDRAVTPIPAAVSSRYIASVPPCFDVYVWVHGDDHADVLSRFIDRYVDTHDPGEPRFDPFVRTFVEQAPQDGDQGALAELRRDPAASQALSLYLHAKHHHEAIITVTEEGAVVLGLGLDDPYKSPQVWERGAAILTSLRAEFAALGGVGGVELAPPQSAAEWAEEAQVQVRQGTAP
jgi:hypothetical protein